MTLISKKNGTLPTVYDLHLQNKNTMKDIMLFPDQDLIHSNIACCRYWMKLNMSEAYKEIWVHPDHVARTVFTTVLGTFKSQVPQMGDCNAPSTFQHLMTTIFHDCINCFVHVYMDDIFILS